MTAAARFSRTRKSFRHIFGVVRDAVRSLATGRGRFGKSMRRLLFSRYAHVMFDKISEAYWDKAHGAADSLGNRWPPLHPSTIASRPVTWRDRDRLKTKKRTKRGLLSPAQDSLWRSIFVQNIKILMAQGMQEQDAKRKAAARAWMTLKETGAKTRKGDLSERRVPIMIDSKRLLNSLQPGSLSVFSYRPPSKNQIYRIKGSTLEIGTRVRHAKFHKHGTKTMPPRPPFPSAESMAPWTRKALQGGLVAVAEQMQKKL